MLFFSSSLASREKDIYTQDCSHFLMKGIFVLKCVRAAELPRAAALYYSHLFPREVSKELLVEMRESKRWKTMTARPEHSAALPPLRPGLWSRGVWLLGKRERESYVCLYSLVDSLVCVSCVALAEPAQR